MANKTVSKKVETFLHTDRRTNIPTAEYQSMVPEETRRPVTISYEKRNPDLDPQLIWRGKYDGDDTLTVQAPPLYIQEKIHPKILIKDLIRESIRERDAQAGRLSLFSDFNGMPLGVDKTDFYKHDQNWTNRMILGDSLQVMASLVEREGMRGKVQCIYMDPPYGIKFNSNFQWSTTSRDVKDGKLDNMTREPEQVKAFRDTWQDGIHSYLSYLRDRFFVARDLLTDSGSIFIQIGDENVHRVRMVMDEVFGEDNFISEIVVTKTGSLSSNFLGNIVDIILWYGKNKDNTLYHNIFIERDPRDEDDYSADPILSSGNSSGAEQIIKFHNNTYSSGVNNHWKTHLEGMHRLAKADRIVPLKKQIRYKRYYQDFPVKPLSNLWNDTGGASDMVYVVQTSTALLQRCILMATDPGDLVLDPTCGSGTTAYVAEQWGRRWITIDTSRVALALARARIMGARYPYYFMADSKEGQLKEAELRNAAPSKEPTYNNIKLGFVYERVPHITLKSIANNTEIDVIYEKWQKKMEPLRLELIKLVETNWEEWQIPTEIDPYIPSWLTSTTQQRVTAGSVDRRARIKKIKELHGAWWEARSSRQEEINASISAHADFELLYDKPYADNKKVRVSGPFTVESLSPHRALSIGSDGELIDPAAVNAGQESNDFVTMILDNLKTSGVQQSHKEDKIDFISLTPWPGDIICAEGHYMEGDIERCAGIFIGPEFGTVSREDLVQASREVADAGFDLLIVCAFNYEATASDFRKLGKVPVLKARMNADLHMGDELKKDRKGNLFVVFGEPDISILQETDDKDMETGNIKVRINGVDVFYPNTGEIRSDNADGIACWFVDTDYNEESFFVRQAYFLGASADPYKALKTTLKAEIDKSTWGTLCSATSRPFPKPDSGRIAVKVINHLGDEVMKVFKV